MRHRRYLPGTPVEAIDWLSVHETLPGEIWSDIHFASYQIYALPSRPVWIDTRIQVVYPLTLFDEYTAISTASSTWQELLNKYDINLLLLAPASQPRLVTALQKNHQWCSIYADNISQIYVRVQENTDCLR